LDIQVPGVRSGEEAAKAAGPKAGPVSKAMARVKWPIFLAKGKSSGQMQFTRDNNLRDPFQVWKDMRNERYHQLRWLAWTIVGASFLFFVLVVRKIKSLWVAQCLGQIFVILGSQLTCYYYSFMILGAPLIKLRRQVEVGLFGLAAVTQIIWMNSYWNDNKYTALTVVSLLFCYLLIAMFWRRKSAAEDLPQSASRDGENAADGDDDELDDEDEDELDDEYEDEDEPAAAPA
jgi:hypothetical protein